MAPGAHIHVHVDRRFRHHHANHPTGPPLLPQPHPPPELLTDRSQGAPAPVAVAARRASTWLLTQRKEQAPWLIGQQNFQAQRRHRDGHGSMSADTEILDCCVETKEMLAAPTDEVYLCTNDKNLQLLAFTKNIQSGSLEEIRSELKERDSVFRRAYRTQLAEGAVGQASCMRRALSADGNPAAAAPPPDAERMARAASTPMPR